jgi:hypothetical protein
MTGIARTHDPRARTNMTFQSFEQALEICLIAENGSREQDEALAYCMEHAPDDLKEMLQARFVDFHVGGKKHAPGQHGADCGCSRGKPGPADFLR